MTTYPAKIDLHMHSIISDGTDTPSEIVHLVREKGFDLFSLTDHDSIKGSAEVRKILKEDEKAGLREVRFLPGVEFSCKDELGKYHILGYNYETTSPIGDVVDKGHMLRLTKVHARLDFLKDEFGFVFSKEDLMDLLAHENPGKPHIGNLMVKYGYAPDKETAIHDFIDKKKFGSAYIRPEEAITGILGSGGIPVLAHPAYGSGDQYIDGEDLKNRVKRLMDFGLKGVEAFYSGFLPQLISEVLAIAEENDLYVTAGSDYHGRNKLVVLGDTNLGEDRPEGMRKFLRDVGI